MNMYQQKSWHDTNFHMTIKSFNALVGENMNLIKKIFKNGWIFNITCSIIATIVIWVVTLIYNNIDILSAAKLVFTTACNIVVFALAFKIPLYIILILISALIMVLAVYSKFSNSKEESLPTFLKCTSTTYRQWIFKWEFKFNTYLKKYEIINTRPICQCGCELSQNQNSIESSGFRTNYSYGTLICPKCSNTYPRISDEDILDFEKVLIHDLTNNTNENQENS